MSEGQKPCAECPFRKNTPAGWLGPWTPDEVFAVVHGEGGLACHVDVGLKGEGLPIEDYKPCVGSLMHANITHKCYRNKRLRVLQDGLENADTSNILGFEFKKYHSTGILSQPEWRRQYIGDWSEDGNPEDNRTRTAGKTRTPKSRRR